MQVVIEKWKNRIYMQCIEPYAHIAPNNSNAKVTMREMNEEKAI